MIDCSKIKKEDFEKEGFSRGVCHNAIETACQYFDFENPVCRYCYDGYRHPCCPAASAEKEKPQEEKK